MPTLCSFSFKYFISLILQLLLLILQVTVALCRLQASRGGYLTLGYGAVFVGQKYGEEDAIFC
jgi:hypothetical protein